MTTIEKLKATKQKTLSEVFTLKCRSQVEIQNATEAKQMQYIREGKRAKDLRRAIISEGVEDEKLSKSKQNEIDEYARIKGYKNITLNEPQFQGHFPGTPVFPGIYILEAFAQLSGLWIFENKNLSSDKICVFMSADKVKWRRLVIPGDKLDIECTVIVNKSKFCKTKCIGYVDGKKVAEAEIMIGTADK